MSFLGGALFGLPVGFSVVCMVRTHECLIEFHACGITKPYICFSLHTYTTPTTFTLHALHRPHYTCTTRLLHCTLWLTLPISYVCVGVCCARTCQSATLGASNAYLFSQFLVGGFVNKYFPNKLERFAVEVRSFFTPFWTFSINNKQTTT